MLQFDRISILLLASLAIYVGDTPPSWADDSTHSTAAPGDSSHNSRSTGRQISNATTQNKTSNQRDWRRAGGTLPTGLGALSRPFGNNGLAGLPPCNLDSFVTSSAFSELVFGDEGSIDSNRNPTLPPYYGFDEWHRLYWTVVEPNPYLSTWHGSDLPTAWGRDEFSGGSEIVESGPNDSPSRF